MNTNGKLVIPNFDDNDTRRVGPVTPTPNPVRCVSCENGPALVDSLCEPCYRKHNLAPSHARLDKLIHEMSVINTTIVRHEARLTEAKVKYNKAVKQNWACSRCGKIFSFYGELFAHESEKSCHSPKAKTFAARRDRLNEDII